MVIRGTVLAGALAGALLMPSGASAASLTLGASCVRDGSSSVGLTLAGFPGNALLRLFSDQDLIDTVQVGEDGGFVGQFPPFGNGDLVRRTTTIRALDDATGTQASAPLTVTDLLTGMVPGKAKWSSKVRFAALGFTESVGKPLFVHVVDARNPARHRFLKTVKLGTLQGPCGSLTTAKVKQLPLKSPKPGVYVLQFDANPAFRSQEGVFVERSVFVPKRRK
jgi:hypothetical protein